MEFPYDIVDVDPETTKELLNDFKGNIQQSSWLK